MGQKHYGLELNRGVSIDNTDKRNGTCSDW